MQRNKTLKEQKRTKEARGVSRSKRTWAKGDKRCDGRKAENKFKKGKKTGPSERGDNKEMK